MKVIAAAMPADEIAGLAEMFKSIDADGSGTITAEELRDALQKKGSLMRPEELAGLLALIDQDQSGCIDYEVGARAGGRAAEQGRRGVWVLMVAGRRWRQGGAASRRPSWACRRRGLLPAPGCAPALDPDRRRAHARPPARPLACAAAPRRRSSSPPR